MQSGTTRRHGTQSVSLALLLTTGLALLVSTYPVNGVVLPEDRADAGYHYYDGGGVKVTGPSVLVRKGFADRVSVYAGYYQDDVSSASIDVVSTASAYKDKRDEYTVGTDLLYQNSLISLSFSNSEESDYSSNFSNINVSHEIFGGMTTVTVGYSQGQDKVLNNNDSSFKEHADTYRYRLGVSQILTKSLIASLNYEGISQSGYLNNPYRYARLQSVYVPEVYPDARNGYAVAFRMIKGLEMDGEKLISSIGGSVRYYNDTWKVDAQEYQVNFQRYFGRDFVGELRGRYYTQTGAEFYADNFSTEQRYMSRDKELSTYSGWSVGARATMKLFESQERRQRGTFSVDYEHLNNSYDDFTDVKNGSAYSFDADVVQIIFSMIY